jgi:hypothetical protein
MKYFHVITVAKSSQSRLITQYVVLLVSEAIVVDNSYLISS